MVGVRSSTRGGSSNDSNQLRYVVGDEAKLLHGQTEELLHEVRSQCTTHAQAGTGRRQSSEGGLDDGAGAVYVKEANAHHDWSMIARQLGWLSGFVFTCHVVCSERLVLVWMYQHGLRKARRRRMWWYPLPRLAP